jgi:hypothetical protein
MIFISLPPFRFFYYSLMLPAADIARGMPEYYWLLFQEVTLCGAVFLLHEGAQDNTAGGGSLWCWKTA